MKPLRDISIERKLALVTTMTTLLALVLVGIGFVFYDMYTFRKSMVQDLSSLAEVIGMNCTASISFGQEDDAKEVLSGLRANHHITQACLFAGENTTPFATYQKEEDTRGPPLLSSVTNDHIFTRKYLILNKAITLNDIPIGSISFKAELSDLQKRRVNYILIMALVALLSLALSLLVMGRMHHIVSTPILDLAKALNLVSHTQDYAIRVKQPGNDEVGQLMCGFNDMLAQIQDRDKQLLQHRNNLEAEVKERTNQLNSAMLEAKRANQIKSQFLANMSHELRTPLNAILGYSEMIEEEAEELGIPEVVPDLQKIRAAGRHLLSLINDILDLSKIEAEQLSMDVMPFSVKALIHEVLATIQPMIERNGNQLKVVLPENPGESVSDMKRMRQILLNLLSNAAKFTENGIIQLTVSRESRGYGAELLIFEVKDSGIGISKDSLEAIFEPFTQADNSSTRKFDGTGLGLSICRRLSEMMGGTITVESTPGEGSVFTLCLPARIDSPDQTLSSETEPGDAHG